MSLPALRLFHVVLIALGVVVSAAPVAGGKGVAPVWGNALIAGGRTTGGQK